MNKFTPGFSLLLATILLSACHNNPLKSNKEEHSTRFLINASVAAVKIVKPEINAREAQYIYLSCMKGKEASIDCNAVYAAMARVAKSSEFSAFKGLNVADLTDKAVFDSLRVGYEERLFYNNLGD